MAFQHCGIVGLGLLGGSLALDLRAHFPGLMITGVARRQETLDEAAALHCSGTPVFTHLATELEALRGADLVILCTPVQTILQQLVELAPLLSAGTLVTDVGSTKRAIMNAAAAVLPPSVTFVGGHPMAGLERTGLAHARGNLYRGATWALCIPPGTEGPASELASLLTTIGARPLQIDADTHDDLVSLTSHLPHIVAAALANTVLGSAYDDMVRPFIGGGFRDTTRIAAGSPEMWRDILLTNRDRVLVALDTMLGELTVWREALRGGDAPHLEALLTLARTRRRALDHDPVTPS